jgi:hypothetical protein
MYGTTMIGSLAAGVTADDLRTELKTWEKERNVPGYVSGHIMVGDDGKTVVNVAIFEDKKSYLKLADDPEQDTWYRQKIAPKLAGDPKWIDGTWAT